VTERCVTCAKNEHCELQKVAAYLGITERRYPTTDRALPVDSSNPFFTLDRNYCILCGKCVRTCDEVPMVNAIELISRGYPTHVSPFGDKPITQSNCISCGECVVRCPTGALVPKETRQAKWEVKSVCPYCGVGCGIELGMSEDGLVCVRGDRDNPVNSGRLCVKGRFGIADFVNHPSRLRRPLIKKNGDFVEASWDEALDLVASKLAKYRGNQFAAISSAKAPNEDNYVFQKFTRAVMGTNNIDHCARL
jgi:predicted molibdopterin-dependent oxidoreductase YjgC